MGARRGRSASKPRTPGSKRRSRGSSLTRRARRCASKRATASASSTTCSSCRSEPSPRLMAAEHPYLSVGLGSDPVAWGALVAAAACAVAALWPRATDRVLRGRTRWVLGALTLLAVALSAGYVAYYLRGGPRIVDATSYWLAARALADGHFTFPVADPEAAFRGRFLLSPGVEASELGVVFPPG